MRSCVGCGDLVQCNRDDARADYRFVIRSDMRPRYRRKIRQWELAKSGSLPRLPSMISSA
ncbi:hypothetical protein BamIOP4010DRAFT_2906 [Burkholderia ambifaria IOP40-10]|uniref:Uncharacterized protein n=1 Tax=Burkholderia ambifaria IOP40-10 TaxID=396596 RepID=B1FFU6_9BURK|nr:hypothetical protein BamIOP4010DRAFT_2906 [Burkholderia ambifaria IOP40-10]